MVLGGGGCPRDIRQRDDSSRSINGTPLSPRTSKIRVPAVQTRPDDDTRPAVGHSAAIYYRPSLEGLLGCLVTG